MKTIVSLSLELLQNLLQTFFKLSAVHRTGDQGSHVQLDQAFAQNRAGHTAGDDALRQTLDDGGLAHAGLTDQSGVVLGATGQNLDDALDLGLAADHGIEPALGGHRRQVNRHLVQQRLIAAGSLLTTAVPAARWRG